MFFWKHENDGLYKQSLTKPSQSSFPDRTIVRPVCFCFDDDDDDDWLRRSWSSSMCAEWFVKNSGCIGVVDLTWPLNVLSLLLNAASSHETYVNKQHNETIDVQNMVLAMIVVMVFTLIGLIIWNEYIDRPFLRRILRPLWTFMESNRGILRVFFSFF